MFPDYTALVLADYNSKKEEDRLSLALLIPSPGKLKDECLKICRARFSKRDGRVLEAFFGNADDVKSSLQAIDKCPLGKFKALQNFINTKTSDPDPKVVELLAWLIDFDQRPYELGKKYHPNYSVTRLAKDEEKVKTELGIGTGDAEENENSRASPVTGEVPGPSNPLSATISKYKPSRKKVITGLVVVAIVLAGATFFLKKDEKPFRVSLTGHEACMYWTGDHYQPISCSQKVKDTLVVALDSARLMGFKRIMQEDTITSKSIGIVWYARLKGQIEYYTSEGNGNHPVDLGTPLHRLTPYMLKTHIKAKQ